MKKTLLFISLFVAMSGMNAQQVMIDNFDRLLVHFQTPTLNIGSQPFANGKVDVLSLEGYQLGGEVGSPALPVSISMITIPFCDDIVVEVSNAVYDTLDASIRMPLPLQPSRSKSDTLRRDPIVNAGIYAIDAYYGMSLASVEVQGVARDRRLANLTFSPVQVNPVTGRIVVCKSADVTVRYVGSDEEGTCEHFRRYHTPAFSAGTSLNQLFSTKDHIASSPIRMVVMVPRSLSCKSLRNYVAWKRSQGLMVDLIYSDLENLETNTAMAEYLKNLYLNATTESPAPTYLLLVGDHAQTPAFNSRLSSSGWGLSNDHISDLYFVTWTSGDYLPDCYQGRFSATDTTTLANIISKTLLYEQYAFEDDSYLGHAALISGEDNGSHQTSGWSADNAWIYCDPTMDYVAKSYVNATNGFDSVSYYKNNTEFAPAGVHVTGYCSASSSATALRNLYTEGMGWINYSAHGDWDRWYKPSFTVTNVSSLNNNGKPSFMIGNCCLTNKFDKNTCFGEALLRRKENAGAVAYIGGTNSTLWDEDFYWAVGVRQNIRNDMDVEYKASNLGMYDRLFHSHGESHDQYVVTAGEIVMSGNMSVNTSSSSYKQYYWEIYELMGDPSLMPWLGPAADLQANFRRDAAEFKVNTVAYAYVAIVDTGNTVPLATAFADASGMATLDIASDVDLSHAHLTVTAQGYKPFFASLSNDVGIDNTPDSQLTLYPNPASDHVTVSLDGLQRVEVLDLTGRTLVCQTSGTVSLATLPAGVYLLRLFTPTATIVKKIIKQ